MLHTDVLCSVRGCGDFGNKGEFPQRDISFCIVVEWKCRAAVACNAQLSLNNLSIISLRCFNAVFYVDQGDSLITLLVHRHDRSFSRN